ncbi:MAG: Hpt domain-containing protein [Chitinophagaceae bacterium]|nr:MAG: Hpt domain-containing protein [Chitinophagaceae bacterium]
MKTCIDETLTEIDDFFSTFTRNPLVFKAEMLSIFNESFEIFKKEIKRAISNEDKKAALFLIHRFKSSLRSIGVSALVDINNELEAELSENNFSERFSKKLSKQMECIEICLKKLS